MEKKYTEHEVKVLGKPWTIRFCSKRYFEKHPEAEKGDTASTVLDDKLILFRAKKVSRETIIHELVHAFLDELCTKSAGLHREQLEEVFADLMSKHGETLLGLATEILGMSKIVKGEK